MTDSLEIEAASLDVTARISERWVWVLGVSEKNNPVKSKNLTLRMYLQRIYLNIPLQTIHC